MTTNEYDPLGHDRGPLSSGVRIQEDYRSHIDRLNGPWPCGPAVVPAIEAEGRDHSPDCQCPLHKAKVEHVEDPFPMSEPPQIGLVIEECHAEDAVDAVVVKGKKSEASN